MLDFTAFVGWVPQVCVLLRRQAPLLVTDAEPLTDDTLCRAQVLKEVVYVHAILHVLVHRA